MAKPLNNSPKKFTKNPKDYYESVSSYASEMGNQYIDLKSSLNIHLQNEFKMSGVYKEIFEVSSIKFHQNSCQVDFLRNTPYHIYDLQHGDTKKKSENECLLNILRKLKETKSKNQTEIKYSIHPGFNLICPQKSDKRTLMEIALAIQKDNPDLLISEKPYDIGIKNYNKGYIFIGGFNSEFLKTKMFDKPKNFVSVSVIQKGDTSVAGLFGLCDSFNGIEF